MLLTLFTSLLLCLKPAKPWAWASVGALALALQLFQLFPYSPLAPSQSAYTTHCTPGNKFTILSINVLQSNNSHSKILKLVRKEQPDIVLAMETDQIWDNALSPLTKDYPSTLLRPQDNRYGMALYSKLLLKNAVIRDLTGEGTPSMRARVQLSGGKTFNFFTVHPRPPHPGQNSGQRDAELVLLAADVKKAGRPTIVVGDFNDVSWSSQMGIFQKIGKLIDPRRGQGFFATFNAHNPLLRWPLDHLFHTDDFGILNFKTGTVNGPDHFPLIATLCLNEARFRKPNAPPQADQNTREEAAEELRKGTGKDVQVKANKLETRK